MSGTRCDGHPVDCDCCSGIDERTPRSVANLPGRSALSYRVGTHPDFFATMLAHISGFLGRADRDEPEPDDDTPMEERVARLVQMALLSPSLLQVEFVEAVGEAAVLAEAAPAPGRHPLSGLTTRQLNDPAVGLLDAWAVVADVLTFYQERIANEGYLATAREERSLRELGWLVGYRPRPGVASQVHLAFTLDDSAVTTIKKGQSAKTVPGPGEQVETFETSADLEARGQWNKLKPLMKRVQVFPAPQTVRQDRNLYLKGTSANLKKNDALVLVFERREEVWRVIEATPNPTEETTTVNVELWGRRRLAADQVTKGGDLIAGATISKALGELQRYLDKPDLGIWLAPGRLKEANDLLAGLVGIGKSPTQALDIEALARIQQLIGDEECPPFDRLVPALRVALRETRIYGPALDTYYADSLEGYGTDPTPLGVYLHLSRKLAKEALADLQPKLADNPVPTEAVSEAAGKAREVQYAATVAGLTNLSQRANRLAETLLDAVKNKLKGSVLRAKLTAVLEKVESGQALGKIPSPLFVRHLATVAAVRRELLREQGDTILFTAKSLKPLLADLRYGVELDDSQTEGLPPLLKQLDKITQEGIKQADKTIRKLVEDQQVEQGTSVVRRITENVSDWYLTPIEQAPKLSAEVMQKLKDALKLPTPEAATETLVLALRLRGATDLAGVFRRERYLFLAGSYPRIKPWFDQLDATIDVLAEVLQDRVDVKVVTDAVRALGPPPTGKSPLATVVYALTRKTPDPLSSLGKQLVGLTGQGERREEDDPLTLKGLFGQEKAGTAQPEDAAQLFQAFHPEIKAKALQVLSNTEIGRQEAVPKVVVLRGTAAPFGSSAPLRAVPAAGQTAGPPRTVNREWALRRTQVVLEVERSKLPKPPVVAVTVGSPEAQRSADIKPGSSEVELVSVSVRVEQQSDGVSCNFTPKGGVVGRVRQVVIRKTGNPEKILVQFDEQPEGVELRPEVGKVVEIKDGQATLDWRLDPGGGSTQVLVAIEYDFPVLPASRRMLALDASYDRMAPGGYVVVQRAEADDLSAAPDPEVFRVEAVESVALADFGISGKVTRLLLNRDWLRPRDVSLSQVRRASVFIQSEPLEFAEEPYDADIHGREIQLDGIYDGLRPGRLIIVEGERSDLPGTPGVRNAELVEVERCDQRIEANSKPPKPATAGVETQSAQGRTSARPHTTLILKSELQFSYKRDTVTIYGNVVAATHGQTQREILGAGDAIAARQSFPLKQRPLTYQPAVNPSGARAELEVRVNDVLWREAERLSLLKPGDRSYLVVTDDLGRTAVQFGDGEKGARLPSGVENVRAVYRFGIGRAGNAKPNQINQLGERPSGVREVVNPLGATGGVDREPPHAVRRNIPAGLAALDRLVSVSDYEDFARRYAGIARAKAVGPGPDVLVTVAGQDDAPLAGSPLLDALKKSLVEFGDESVGVTVEHRRLYFVVLEADITVHPDHLWKNVERDVRARLLSVLGFDQRELDQDVLLSPVVAAMHGVAGVRAAHVKVFGLVPEQENKVALSPSQIAGKIAEAAKKAAPPDVLEQEKGTGGRPAALAYLTPRVPATLILHEKKP
jgi:hypothetical protein